ncbi:MAG: hypothetical protein AW12_02824 [Candidatus Accumulibacter sp. BA-94]|nr:MAG: hypothetical protein AW12_02824 [Candidatus Accumulibacter sp. BA-94]
MYLHFNGAGVFRERADDSLAAMLVLIVLVELTLRADH